MPEGSRAILDGVIVDSSWQHIPADAETVPSGDITVSLSWWRENHSELNGHDGRIGVRVDGSEDPMELAEDLDSLPLVVLEIDTLVDGRSYSHAYLLRQRLGYQGEVRAIGDVHRDQLNFLARCGVNAFELAEGEDPEDALKAFKEFSVVYQPSADDGELVFARRRSA